LSRRLAIVVGGGFGGIAAALRLRARGLEVRLIDRCVRLGGRAQVFERGGYRHDAGPTVLTAPYLFDELFELFGESRADHIPFVPLDPWYRFRFADGETFDYGGSLEATLAEIRRIAPADVDGYLALLRESEGIFKVGFEQLGDQPFHRFSTMLRQLPALLRLGARRTVWQLVCAHLSSPYLRQAFSIQPLLVGGNPFDTTCIYSLIHYLEMRWGVHFAMGGTGALVDALAGLMQRAGIEVELGRTVERITTRSGRAVGVELDDGRALPCDLVVSDADPVHVYGNMLDAGEATRAARLKARHSRLSMGLFVLYFGTQRRYDDVAHHTIWLGQRYRELLDDIFHHQHLADDFSLYLHRPTATDNSFAPTGCDSFYVLAPVPNLRSGIDWNEAAPRLQERIIAALDASILPGLQQSIVEPFVMHPGHFSERYLSVGGSGFSVAPHFTQSAWFRFHNRGEGVENLFLVGAGTHPGAGLPGVLSSAKVVDRLLDAREGLRAPARGGLPAGSDELARATGRLARRGVSR
jgi:phytoene desaturase